MCDARIRNIFDGIAEIQAYVIARSRSAGGTRGAIRPRHIDVIDPVATRRLLVAESPSIRRICCWQNLLVLNSASAQYSRQEDNQILDSGATMANNLDGAWRPFMAPASFVALAILSAILIVSVFFQSIKAPFPLGALYSLVGLGSVWAVVWLLRDRISGWLSAASNIAIGIPRTRWVFGCFVVGAALRIAFGLAYPSELISDETAYAALAVRLVEEGVYEIGGARSFWPPGTPLFYFPGVWLVGWQPWLPLAHNLLLFGATLCVVERLAVRVLNDRSARIAGLIITLWPNLILLVNSPGKELLVAALLPSSVLLYLVAIREPRRVLSLAAACGAGLPLGFAALAQPSTALFAFVLFLAVPLGSIALALRRWLLLVAVAILTVLPWSLRNYAVHGEIVPISTNGGGVFLSANNPEATGGWMESPSSTFTDDEVAASKQGYREGRAWIANNPSAFLKLIPIKITRLFGDDAYAVFRTFEHPAISGRYESATGSFLGWTSNAYWYLLIVLITAGAFLGLAAASSFDPRFLLIVGGIWYFIAIHAVFQSEAKHHINFAAFLAIAASIPARGLGAGRGDAPGHSKAVSADAT